MEEAAKLPKDIREEYEGSLYLQSLALRRNRPYGGILPERNNDGKRDAEGDTDDNAPKGRRLDARLNLARGIDTDVSGVDVLIILVRQLISFGFSIDNDEGATAEQKLLISTAMKDIGWDKDEDWEVKRVLLKGLFGNSRIDETFIERAGEKLSLVQLMQHKALRDMFTQGKDFRFFSQCGMFSLDKIKAEVEASFEPAKDYNYEEVWWDGKGTLSKHLEGRFEARKATKIDKGEVGNDVEGFFFPTGARPKFIGIRYRHEENNDAPTEFGKFVTIDTRLPALFPNNEAKAYGFGAHRESYNICASIRLADKGKGLKDDIRIYWKDGGELVPMNIGDKTYKLTSQTDWTVEKPGSYMIFYYRMVILDPKVNMEPGMRIREVWPRNQIPPPRVDQTEKSEQVSKSQSRGLTREEIAELNIPTGPRSKSSDNHRHSRADGGRSRGRGSTRGGFWAGGDQGSSKGQSSSFTSRDSQPEGEDGRNLTRKKSKGNSSRDKRRDE